MVMDNTGEKLLQEDFEFGKYDGHHTYFETQGIIQKKTPLS